MATRDISPLELVLIDEPAVVGPATKTQPICLECLKGTMLIISVLTRPSVWYAIGVLWANITPVKSHPTALVFCLQTDMNRIFQMWYFTFLQVKWLQKFLRSKLEVKNWRIGQIWHQCALALAELADFFWISNFDLKYFYSLSICKNLKSLIWKIWFISVWRQKSKHDF